MDTITKQVSRKRSVFAPLLQGAMIVFAVLFMLAGIMLDRGFMLPCFLMAGLYYVYRTFSQRDYEYIWQGHELTIDRIYGRAMRRTALVLDLREMLVLAPHDAQVVAPYRKGGRKQVKKKYDFTSYDDRIPYYTMIIRDDEETMKVLLDLDDEVLSMLKRFYPDKVYRS